MPLLICNFQIKSRFFNLLKQINAERCSASLPGQMGKRRSVNQLSYLAVNKIFECFLTCGIRSDAQRCVPVLSCGCIGDHRFKHSVTIKSLEKDYPGADFMESSWTWICSNLNSLSQPEDCHPRRDCSGCFKLKYQLLRDSHFRWRFSKLITAIIRSNAGI